MLRLLARQHIHRVQPQRVISVSFGKMFWYYLRSLPRLVWSSPRCWVLVICMSYGYQACFLSGFGVSFCLYKLCSSFSRYCFTRCPRHGPPMGCTPQVITHPLEIHDTPSRSIRYTSYIWYTHTYIHLELPLAPLFSRNYCHKHFRVHQHSLSMHFLETSSQPSFSTQPTLSTGEVIGMKVFACFGYVICFLYLCFLIVMRKRVQVYHTLSIKLHVVYLYFNTLPPSIHPFITYYININIHPITTVGHTYCARSSESNG